jgi:hypothetical protein
LSGDVVFESDGMVQAEFFQELIAIPEYHERVNRLFLGSIISSYLEMDIDDSKLNEKQLLLDTNCIISLLGLHSEDSQNNCKLIIDIARTMKYKVEVLPFTIEETASLLLRIAGNLNSSTYFQSQDKNSIYYGCSRNGISSDGLVMIARKFPYRLSDEYGIIIVDKKIDEVLRGRALKSDIYAKLKDRTNNPDGALHDAASLLYVRDKRKGTPNSFKDIDSWFVSDTKGISENAKIKHNNAPLIIRAEELLNVLWLTHPVIDSRALSKNIVLKAISSTLTQSLPSKKMLKEMDQTIDSIKDYPINTHDCVKVAENIACYDNTELKLIIEKEHQKEIVEELHRAALLAEERQAKKVDEINEFWIMIKEKYEESTRREVAMVRIKAAEERGAIEMEKNNTIVNEKIHSLETILSRDKEALTDINSDIEERIIQKAANRGRSILVSVGIVNIILVGIACFFIVKYWDYSEPYISVIPIIPLFVTYFIAAIKMKEVNLVDIIKKVQIRVLNKIQNKNIKLIERKDVIEERIKVSEKEIDDLQKKLVF